MLPSLNNQRQKMSIIQEGRMCVGWIYTVVVGNSYNAAQVIFIRLGSYQTNLWNNLPLFYYEYLNTSFFECVQLKCHVTSWFHLLSPLKDDLSYRCKSIYLISQTNSLDSQPRTLNHTCLQAGSLHEWFSLMHQWNWIKVWEEQQTFDKRIQSIITSVALHMLNSCKSKRVGASLERCAFNCVFIVDTFFCFPFHYSIFNYKNLVCFGQY